ncbi:MAG: SDR family oxidoreductase [Fibrobacterota bacterium]
MKKIAIITGAGRGIGRAICLTLAEKLGLNIVAVDIDEKNLQNLVVEIKKRGQDAIACVCNIAEAAEVEKMTAQAFDFGDVDVLVNNAGITRDALLLKLEEADWDLVLNVNLKSMFLTSKAVCGRWVAAAKQKAALTATAPFSYDKKKIVNISSIVAKAGNIGQSNYASSKAGVLGFTKTIAREMARYNINVNAVQPGFIKTEMTEKIPEKVINKILPAIPLGHQGMPEDIANTVKFLASAEADYITGFSIEVTGGLEM